MRVFDYVTSSESFFSKTKAKAPQALVVIACLTLSSLVWAQSSGSADTKPKASDTSRPEGHVWTYYGLRKLEHDSNVSEEEKLKEWESYIERTKKNLEYARTAVDRWKNAARQRVLENVRKDDKDTALRPEEKMKRWKRIEQLYPKSKAARLAKKRIAFWRTAETKLRVESAEEVERKRGSKVERIKAWKEVSAWTKKGSETLAANKRIAALQRQLFEEAQSLDRIARVDAKTKLASWQDVLQGDPTPRQRRLAKKRIRVLEKEAGK